MASITTRTDAIDDEALKHLLQEYIRINGVHVNTINHLHNELDQKDELLAEKDTRIEALLAFTKRLQEELDSWQKEADHQ
tara:strand:+ start:1523 stop:1762 length:240 start_codon:yes stop_codon:yes gene_type:complete